MLSPHPTFDNVPRELRDKAHWVLWKRETRGGKPTKVPYCARTALRADTTRCETWSSYDETRTRWDAGGFDGIGFVFKDGDGYVGVDLDKCRDPASGEFESWASEIVKCLDSYAEVSPSGTGVHVIARGVLPAGRRRKGRIEMYDQGRYFAMTGDHVESAPTTIAARQAEIDALHARVFGGSESEGPGAVESAPAARPTRDDDNALLDRARRAKNGPAFSRLFDAGDISGHPSPSEADLALCSMLAFWTNRDSEQMDRLFRASALVREKWDSARGKSTYGSDTIATAIRGTKEGVRGRAGRATARSAASSGSPEQTRTAESTEILIPGGHKTDTGEYIDVGTDDFTRSLLGALGDELIYRMDFVVGEIVGEVGHRRFVELAENRVRILVDERVRLVKWVKDRETQQQFLVFVACTKDHAALLLAAAGVSLRVRELQILVHFPVYLPGVVLAKPGWNERGGVYYDEPTDLVGLKPNAAGALDVLDDLVIDFPLKDEASRQNVFGMMLTAILRPAVDGCVPFFLLLASLERTGKGKLIDVTLGVAVGGERISPVQLGTTEEEREKRITSLIVRGSTSVHFDNVPGGEVLDSPSLASLGTAYPKWMGRLLGVSKAPELPNRMVVVMSGNNVRATGELCKRTVPITLESKTPRPELRDDFKHPDCYAYARERRRAVLQAFLGMVEAAKAANLPAASFRMGGFEQWVALVGSVLRVAGATQWMENYRAWVRCADDESADAETLVREWWRRHQGAEITATKVLELVAATGTYQRVLVNPDQHARVISLTRRVLSLLVDRPVAGWVVRRKPSGSSSTYYLVEGTP